MRGISGIDLVNEIKTVHGGKCSCFADIKAFIESGAAKKDGTWYAFMMEINGVAWLVHFRWLDDVFRQGWHLRADHPEDYVFHAGGRFLFRDSA